MNSLMLYLKIIIEWAICIFIAAIFYKNAAKKVNVIFSFYMSLSQYRFFKEGILLKLLSSLIVSIELVTSILILIPQYRIYTCIVGITLQLFYLLTLVTNYNKSFDYNCGCFSINAPKRVDFKGVIFNQLFLFIFISILILKRN